jgi:hypothetical protein
MFTRVGFVIDKSLGNKGDFIYPTPEYIAYVLGIMDARTLATSLPFDRNRMLQLRSNPEQTILETGPKGELEVLYELKVPEPKPNTLVNQMEPKNK